LIESNVPVKRLGRVGRPRQPRSGFEKWEIEKFLAEGERIAGVYVVSRDGEPLPSRYAPSLDFWVFISITGMRGYYALLASRSAEQRVFRSFDRMYRTLREMGYRGPIAVYDEEDPRRPAEPGGATRRRPGDKTAVPALK
jgi:hypothetical protein